MIREITDWQDPAVCGFLELWIASFHAWGREPVPELVNQLRNGVEQATGLKVRFWVAEIEGDVVGILRGPYLPRTKCGFVIHIAVDPKSRGRGIAQEMLDAAESGFKAESSGEFAGLLFEVERVEDAETDDHRTENTARIRFFEHMGCKLVTPSYTQPAMGPWLPPMPLNLYLRPGNISCDLESLMMSFYEEVFQLPKDHTYVQGAISGIGSPLPRKLLI